MWIDMNEMSNFCVGECPPSTTPMHGSVTSKDTIMVVKDTTGPLDLRWPPYVPGEMADMNDLWDKTTSLNAVAGNMNNHFVGAYTTAAILYSCIVDFNLDLYTQEEPMCTILIPSMDTLS